MMWFLPVLLVFFRAVLSFIKHTGVMYQQVAFVANPPVIFNFSSWTIHKIWFAAFGSGEIQLRILGLGFAILAAISITQWLREKINLPVSILFSIIFLSPGFWAASFWYIPEVITLAILGPVLNSKVNKIGQTLLLILMGTTSMPGMVGAVIISGWLIYKKRLWGWAALGVMVIFMILGRNELKNIYRSSVLSGISWTTSGQKINLDLQYISLGNEHLPVSAFVQKFAYNKVVYIGDFVLNQMIGTLDFTGWLAPQEAWQIVNLSGYPTKGVWPIASYWELGMALIGMLTGISGAPWILGISALITGAIYGNYEFGKYGIFLLPLLWFFTASMVKKMVNRFGPRSVWVIMGFYLAGSISLWQTSFLHIDTFLPARDTAYGKIHELIIQARENSEKQIVVSDRLGQTKDVMQFYSNYTLKNVVYEEITPTNLKPGRMYIGFDGEFKGPKKSFGPDEPMPGEVIYKIDLPNEPIYLFGTKLWLINY